MFDFLLQKDPMTAYVVVCIVLLRVSRSVNYKQLKNSKVFFLTSFHKIISLIFKHGPKNSPSLFPKYNIKSDRTSPDHAEPESAQRSAGPV